MRKLNASISKVANFQDVNIKAVSLHISALSNNVFGLANDLNVVKTDDSE